jgi:hypothetical protein
VGAKKKKKKKKKKKRRRRRIILPLDAAQYELLKASLDKHVKPLGRLGHRQGTSWLLAEYNSGDELIYSVQGKRVLIEPNPSRQRTQHEVSISLLIRVHFIFITLVIVCRIRLRSTLCCGKYVIHTHSHTFMFREASDTAQKR